MGSTGKSLEWGKSRGHAASAEQEKKKKKKKKKRKKQRLKKLERGLGKRNEGI